MSQTCQKTFRERSIREKKSTKRISSQILPLSPSRSMLSNVGDCTVPDSMNNTHTGPYRDAQSSPTDKRWARGFRTGSGKLIVGQSELREHFRCHHLGLCLIFYCLVVTDKGLADRAWIGWNSGPQIGAFFSHWASDGRALHFAFVINDNTSIIFEVEEGATFSSVGFWLADDNRGMNLNNNVNTMEK